MLREETAANPARRTAALAGLAAYQAAPRDPPPRPAPARFRRGRARLRDYGSARSDAAPPVIVVPSLINPPHILDLTPRNSLMRWLAGQRLHPYLLDWGVPTAADRDLDVSGHVERLLLPLIARFDRPPLLVGYCLGGTMALAAAAAGGVAGVATIAAPWRFAGYGAAARADMQRLWQAAEQPCAALGLVPMEVLQAGFWRLDPARTVAKFETFASLDPGSERARAFVALEDWANAGAPLTYAAGRQIFDAFAGADLPGSGRWTVAGVAVDPQGLPCPAVEFVSLTDRIVPAATSADLPQRREVAAGHVGMIVGGGARETLWDPLAQWLSRVADGV